MTKMDFFVKSEWGSHWEPESPFGVTKWSEWPNGVCSSFAFQGRKHCLIWAAPAGLSCSVAAWRALKWDLWQGSGKGKKQDAEQSYSSSSWNCVMCLESDTCLHTLINVDIQIYLGHAKGYILYFPYMIQYRGFYSQKETSVFFSSLDTIHGILNQEPMKVEVKKKQQQTNKQFLSYRFWSEKEIYKLKIQQVCLFTKSIPKV